MNGIHCLGAVIYTGARGGDPMVYTWGGTKEYEEVVKNRKRKNLERVYKVLGTAYA